MEKEPIIYIEDILFSINLIEDYTAGIDYNVFEENYGIQDQVLRRLEIIAEAAKKIPDIIRETYTSIPWKSIIGLRNVIAHNYDEVNLKEIWKIISTHLPDTKVQIEKIKEEYKKKV